MQSLYSLDELIRVTGGETEQRIVLVVRGAAHGWSSPKVNWPIMDKTRRKVNSKCLLKMEGCGIGRIIAKVDALGIASITENTIIMVMGDNGTMTQYMGLSGAHLSPRG